MRVVSFGFDCNLIWFSRKGTSYREQAVFAGDTLIVKSVESEPYKPVNAIDFTAKYRLESEDGFYTNVFESQKEKITVLPD